MRSSRGFLAICIALVVVAAGARIRAAQNDLWLDEIWSLNLAHGISSPLGILTGIHLDNNHYLNTLFLYLLPDRGNWWGYRMLSIVAGIGAVMLAGLIGSRRSRVNAIVLMFLMTFSYVFILYSSEARGYSLLTFFVLLSFLMLDRCLESPSAGLAMYFSASSILGMLSHLTFVSFYLVALLWSAYRLFLRREGARRFIANMLRCHALPILFLTGLYLADVRYQTSGGGRLGVTALGAFGEAFGWTWGVAGGDQAELVLSIGILIGLCLSYRGRPQWWKEAGSWIVPACAGIVVPLVVVSIYDSAFLYVRYFLVAITFLLILASRCLTSLFERGGWGRVACVVLLGAYAGVNGAHTWTLFSFGRGQYSEAVRYLRENSRRGEVVVSGDHPFRIPTTLAFFTRSIPGVKDVRFLTPAEFPAEGPEWVIFHKESFEDPKADAARIADAAGRRYVLEKSYRSAPLSGLHWFLYHNLASGMLPPAAP